MSLSRLRAACLAVPALLLAACGDATGSGDPLTVTARATLEGAPAVRYADDGSPYLQCDVGVIAEVTGKGSGEFTSAVLRFYVGTGRAELLDSIVVRGSELQGAWNDGTNAITGGRTRGSRWRLAAGVPFDADIVLRYRAGGGKERSATASTRCGPPAPASAAAPEVTLLEANARPGPLQAGDTLFVLYTATSGASIWRTRLLLGGGCTAQVDFVEPLTTSVSHSVPVSLPASCTLGAPITATVLVLDGASRQVSRTVTTPFSLTDLTPPVSVPIVYTTGGASTTAGPLAGVLFPGDSLVVEPHAYDAGGLAWLVWEIQPSGERDSLPIGATTFNVWLTARASWANMTALRLRVRDRAGLESPWAEFPRGTLSIGTDVVRSSRSVTIGGEIRAAVVDPKRNVLYLAQGLQNRIAVLDVATMTVARTIELGQPPASIDLTVGGDSLLVALSQSRALGIIDLRAASPTLVQVPLPSVPAGPEYGLSQVVATANGHAFVMVLSNLANGSPIVDVDLATGTSRARPDGVRGALARSGDYRTVALTWDWTNARVWTSATDAFGAPVTLPELGNAASLDATGARVAMGRYLYDGAFGFLRSAQVPRCDCFDAFALSNDGASLYYVPGPWVVRARTSDGVVVDRAAFTRPTPAPGTGNWQSTRLLTWPGSQRLVVTYSSQSPGSGGIVIIE